MQTIQSQNPLRISTDVSHNLQGRVNHLTDLVGNQIAEALSSGLFGFRFNIRDPRKLALLSLIMCSICWSCGTLWTKSALDYFPPLLLLVVQLGASSAFLWTLSLLNGSARAINRKSMWVGVSGVLEPGLAYVFGIQGLAITSVSSAALLGAIDPLIVVGLAWLLLRERITKKMALFAGLALTGTIFVEVTGVGGGIALHGLLLLFASILCAALYGVISKRDSTLLPPVPLTALNQTFGLLTAIAALLISGQINTEGIPAQAWQAAIVTGVTQYAMAFLFYVMAIKHVTAGSASVMLMLVPILSLAGAVVVLGESFSMLQMAGGAVTMFALARFNHHAHEAA